MPVFVRVGGVDHAGHVAVRDQRDGRAGLAHRRDQVGMARPVHDQRGDVGRCHALRLRQIADVLLRRRIEIDHALGIAGADRDLVHVDVGRIEQRSALRHRHGGNRARHVLGAQRRAFERIDRDIDLRAGLAPHLLADEQHRRLVALALADHDGAVDRQLVELAPHGVDGRLVGRLFVATPAQPRSRYRGTLGHTHDLERKDALEHLVGLNRNRRHSRFPLGDTQTARPLNSFQSE